MAKPIVRICVPYTNHGSIKPKCLESLEKVLLTTEIDPQIRPIQGTDIANQRNAGVNERSSWKAKQKVDFDYYLAIDSDIAFETSQILRLMSHDLPIVGGAYACRNNAGKYAAGYFKDTNINHVTPELMVSTEKTGLCQVDWIAAGFLLIKREVFEATEYPWFRYLVTPFVDEWGDKCNTWVGEDIGFCVAAKQAGYNVYVDLDCRVEHLLDVQPSNSDLIYTFDYKA